MMVIIFNHNSKDVQMLRSCDLLCLYYLLLWTVNPGGTFILSVLGGFFVYNL